MLQRFAVKADMNFVHVCRGAFIDAAAAVQDMSAVDPVEKEQISKAHAQYRGINLPHHIYNPPLRLTYVHRYDPPKLEFVAEERSLNMYLQDFSIQPIAFTFSFKNTVAASSYLSYDDVLTKLAWGLNVEDHSFVVNAFNVKFDCIRATALLSSAKIFAVSTLFRQAAFLVQSLEVIGNPGKLVTKFAGGVSDLFWKPIEGFAGSGGGVDSIGSSNTHTHTHTIFPDDEEVAYGTPGAAVLEIERRRRMQRRQQEKMNVGGSHIGTDRVRGDANVGGVRGLSRGLGQGVDSFSKNIVSGTAGTVSKLAGTASTLLGAVTFDEQYIRLQHEMELDKPRHLGEGLQKGAVSISRGVIDGFTGVLLQPYDGAQQDGVEGFVKGVYRGLVGAVVKPIAGILDFTKLTATGLQSTADPRVEVCRRRPPRLLYGTERVLRPFHLTDARLKAKMNFSEKGKNWSQAAVLAHVHDRSASKVMVISDGYVFALELSAERRGLLFEALLWQVVDTRLVGSSKDPSWKPPCKGYTNYNTHTQTHTINNIFNKSESGKLHELRDTIEIHVCTIPLSVPTLHYLHFSSNARASDANQILRVYAQSNQNWSLIGRFQEEAKMRY
eukprot:GHVR01105069.1.p1 GENE.GHVR01105069.1~~GHVR01105069.1.p1  ORF type:complete len:610 (+),score=186.22 GHVR01105069.1:1523-3352(+)